MPRPGEVVPQEEEIEDLQSVEIPEEPADPAAPKEVDLAEEEEKAEIAKMDRTKQNEAFAAMRREAAEAKKERDELRRVIEENKRAAAAPVTPTYPPLSSGEQRETIGGIPVPRTKQEWDALARQDWQAAVDMKSIINARRLQEEARTADTHARTLEETKQKVLAKHPELADATSEKGRIFLSILDKNPDYLKMSKGPLFAMREMEEEMLNQGYTSEQIFESKKAVARAEATRVNRASLTGGGRMPEKQGRTIQLSKDDMEFCKTQGLDPVDYARERAALEANKKGA